MKKLIMMAMALAIVCSASFADDNLKEIRDVYPSHYTFTEAMRNILGSLDIISERNNKENE